MPPRRPIRFITTKLRLTDGRFARRGGSSKGHRGVRTYARGQPRGQLREQVRATESNSDRLRAPYTPQTYLLVRVVVPAAAGSSPVAHPPKGPAKRAFSHSRFLRLGAYGANAGKFPLSIGAYSASLRLSASRRCVTHGSSTPLRNRSTT